MEGHVGSLVMLLGVALLSGWVAGLIVIAIAQMAGRRDE